jgi:hypothetical protein
MATVQQTMNAINQTCKAKGGKYSQYSCQVVSWDDVSRGTVGGSLSCWGSNITDTYLKSKDGTLLYTVRPDNWNEKLGMVSSNEVALVAGNHQPGSRNLAPVTLRTFLSKLGDFGSYANLSTVLDLSVDKLDQQCSIRFQTTFLPVTGARGTMEFATEAYNYNTTSDSDPRNLVLLCTSQGVAVQQDGAGAKQLFHHAVDDEGSIHRYWLEAERSEHKVGGQQIETAEERSAAQQRGKATASVIGIKAMGTRFNVLMTIQVPLKQTSISPSCVVFSPSCVEYDMCCEEDCDGLQSLMPMSASLECESASFQSFSCAQAASIPRIGTSNAARVSKGSEVDVWSGLSIHTPQRHESEHVTITVVMYNTVVDGIPSEADVLAAIDDLEALYEACSTSGRLADASFDFMKEELTVKTMQDIKTKLSTQPYQPPPLFVQNFDVFPA